MNYIPKRKCIACRKILPKNQLVRITRLPDGTYHLDKTNSADGRGAYICNCSECIAQVIQKKSLNQAFKTKVPDECYDKLKKLTEDTPE